MIQSRLANSPVPAALATFTVEPMGRKQFNTFIYDLFGLKFPQSNDVKPDVDIDGEIHHVELFNSPEGPIIALHELHAVRVIRVGRDIERKTVIRTIEAMQKWAKDAVQVSVSETKPRVRIKANGQKS
ncbi:hypothetical protein [Mesorhizobium sp.]|uniref:hypothetical protein n=1 Tax=Mesorhizobium sp. TaxID=1871066 RepID=UPI000FE6530D|nr:hypothetical protein [Mesorhizobium sp.]RWP57999.1 MAG: hypothetical protein EOR08_28745 [Mesorhizobium sp.]